MTAFDSGEHLFVLNCTSKDRCGRGLALVQFALVDCILLHEG